MLMPVLSFSIKDCFGMKNKVTRVIKRLGVTILNGEKILCRKGVGVFDATGNTSDTIRLRRPENTCVKIKKICKKGLIFEEIYELGHTDSKHIQPVQGVKGDMWHLFGKNNLK